MAQETTPEEQAAIAEQMLLGEREKTPEQELLIAERAPYTTKIDGGQEPGSVPDFVVWSYFFLSRFADVEPLLTREDAVALRNGVTQWGAINDQHNMEARNDLTDIVGSDVDSIDPKAVAEELDRRHKARHARLMAVANTTLASLSVAGRLTVEEYVHTNIRSRTNFDSFDDVGYARDYPERYRESLRFRLLPEEEQKRVFFGANPELDPANRKDLSYSGGGFVARPLPDGTQSIEPADK